MNRKLMFSSKNNSWCTPQDFFDKLNKEFDFTLDPCATKKSAKCKKFYTPKDDGLSKNWGGERVFCNPPYGREISKWVYKCLAEVINGCELAVMLIPARTDTRYFHEYILGKAEIRFIKGRLKFVDLDYQGKEEDRKMSPAPFPSMLVIYK
jgi:phage N-6-adenine-methyltransferase